MEPAKKTCAFIILTLIIMNSGIAQNIAPQETLQQEDDLSQIAKEGSEKEYQDTEMTTPDGAESQQVELEPQDDFILDLEAEIQEDPELKEIEAELAQEEGPIKEEQSGAFTQEELNLSSQPTNGVDDITQLASMILMRIKKIAPKITLKEVEDAGITGKELSFDTTLPGLGTFTFKGTIDLYGMSFKFVGTIQNPKELRYGPLSISELKATFSTDTEMQISGNALVLNKTKFAIKPMKYVPEQEIVFELEAKKPLIITVTPWEKVPVKTLQLKLTGKEQQLFAKTPLFNSTAANASTINFDLKTPGKAEIKTTKLNLSQLIPALKGTLFDKLETKDVLIALDNVEKNQGTTINSTTDYTAFGESFPVKLNLKNLATVIKIDEKGEVDFKAQMPVDQTIKPFKDIPILDGIVLSKIRLGLGLKPVSLFLEGVYTLYNVPWKGQLHSSPKGIVLKTQVQDGWKISNILPQAKGTFVDAIPMYNIGLALSSRQYYDEELGVAITKGVNLIADFPLRRVIMDAIAGDTDQEALAVLKKDADWQTKIPKSLKLYGSLGPSLAHLNLKLILTAETAKLLTLPNGLDVKLGNLAVQINGSGPSAGVVGEFTAKPSAQDDPLLFSTVLELKRTILNLSGSMLGTWNDPLGIATKFGLKKEALAINDVAISVGYDIMRIIAPIVLIGLGATGVASGTVALGSLGGAAILAALSAGLGILGIASGLAGLISGAIGLIMAAGGLITSLTSGALAMLAVLAFAVGAALIEIGVGAVGIVGAAIMGLFSLAGIAVTLLLTTGTLAGAAGAGIGALGTVGLGGTAVVSAIGAGGLATLSAGSAAASAVSFFGAAMTIPFMLKAYASLFLPNNLGFTGKLKVGDASAKIATQLSTDIDQTALAAKLVREAKDEKTGQPRDEMIRLKDLVYFARDLGVQIPQPFINGLENMGDFGYLGELYFCPVGTRIGQIVIDPGLTLKGQVSVPNPFKILDQKQPKSLFAKIGGSISIENGIMAQGGLSPIRVGDFFEITGAGFDKRKGTDDDGPTLLVEIGPKKQEFYLSGIVNTFKNLGPLAAGSEIEMRLDPYKAKFLAKSSLLGNKVNIELRAESIGQNLGLIQDFKVHGLFKDDFSSLVEDEIKKIIATAQQTITSGLSAKEQEIKQKEEEVTKLRTEVDAMYQQRMKGPGGQLVINLKNKQAEVDNINREIDALQRQHDSTPWYRVDQQTVLKAQIAAKWVAHKAAMVALQAAKIAVATFTGNLDAEITVKETALFAAQEALRIARTGIGLARKTAADTGAISADVLSKIANTFKVKQAALDFSLAELLQKGVLPKLTFSATVLGKDIEGSIAADFNNPNKLFTDIFNVIQQFLK